GEAGGQREHAAARLEQSREGAALEPAGCGELDRREERRSRGPDVRVGGNELRLGAGDVGPPRQQLRRYAGRDRRRGEGGEAGGCDIEGLRRLPGQDRQRIDLLALLLLERGDRGRDRRDDRILLRDVERVRSARLLIGRQALQG